MRALKILIIVSSSLMVAFLLWNLTLSSEYSIEVKQQINAEPSEIKEQLTDLENWKNWATYLKRDSTKAVSFSTPSMGENAWVEWRLNEQSGGGRLEILEIEEGEMYLAISLSGFSTVDCQMMWEETAEGTILTWTAKGELPFFARFAKSRFKDVIAEDFKASMTNLAESLN